MFCKKSWVGGCVAEFIYAEGYSTEHTRQLISIADNDDTIQNISYDEEKAQNVSYGYLPNVDDTLASGTGICFDYAALMTAMLRSQNIPTKLEVGYSGDTYHAWISTYVDDKGWVDNIIEFDGDSWQIMDPTLGANFDS